MKLGIVSDLHIDTHTPQTLRKLYETLEDGLKYDFDYLIIAGDLANGAIKNLKYITDFFGELSKKIIYIPGNHCYWDGSFTDFAANKHKLPFAHVLDNQFLELEGVKIFGGTLWFELLPDPMYNMLTRWPDFAYIKDWKGIFKSRDEFLKNIGPCDIVVSHHLPSFKCVHPSWRNERSNIFFANNIDNIIEKVAPSYWIFGHTHNVMEFNYNEKTKCICNPLGYPGELTSKYAVKVIEV